MVIRALRSSSFLQSTLVLGAFLFGSEGRSSHIIGGELYYDHLGGSLYQVTLKLYRDCSSTVLFDNAAPIGVFTGDGVFIYTQNLNFPGSQTVPVVLESPCLTLPPNVCVETTSYTGVFDLPSSPTGYQLAYQRCCRTSQIVNLPDPGSLGLTCTVRVPGETIAANSSARFSELPPVALCLNEPLSFDHSATDPDGDMLVYELCAPFNGATPAAPQPTQPSDPPYATVPWSAGYSPTYPIDSDPAIAIDPVTGLLTLTPTTQGSFVVGVCVKEYRDGELLSETRRDFMFTVVLCNATVVASIVPQAQTPEQFCAGLTMQLTNASFGAQTWSWDFGDPSTDADTSSAHSPQWTYGQEGTCTVTLVANPGTVCADTTTQVFEVYFAPEPSFAQPPPLCGPEQIQLDAMGWFSPAADLSWQMGGGSSPSSASGPIVSVDFPGPGTYPVTITAQQNGCTGSYGADIVVHAQPVADLGASPGSPQIVGVPVDLHDLSSVQGGIISGWAWTANGVAVPGVGPDAVWTTTWPGSYELALTVTTADGCSDQRTLEYIVIGGPITVPNVFTPNGDASNQTFHITNIDHYNNELIVYGRWGDIVFQATNYRNQWDGGDTPDGTYFYVLRINDKLDLSGHVTLLR